MIEHEQYYKKGGTYELPIEIYNDLIGQIEEAQKERNDYKSRCEKANEYVNKMWIAKLTPDIVSKTKGDLLNILNGGNEK